MDKTKLGTLELVGVVPKNLTTVSNKFGFSTQLSRRNETEKRQHRALEARANKTIFAICLFWILLRLVAILEVNMLFPVPV